MYMKFTAFPASPLVAFSLPLLYGSRLSEPLFLVTSNYCIRSIEYRHSLTGLDNVPTVINIITPLIPVMALKSESPMLGSTRVNVSLQKLNVLIAMQATRPMINPAQPTNVNATYRNFQENIISSSVSSVNFPG